MQARHLRAVIGHWNFSSCLLVDFEDLTGFGIKLNCRPGGVGKAVIADHHRTAAVLVLENPDEVIVRRVYLRPPDGSDRRAFENIFGVVAGFHPVDARAAELHQKDASTVEEFKKDLEAHGGQAKQIEEACLDMSPAFIRGLKDQFPLAELTFDNFHLMQLLGEAVDEVRRQEQRTHPELKGTRYVWLKNDWNRTIKQAETFQTLRTSKLATVRATHLRSVFQDLFACHSVQEAEPLLKHWYFWATHSRMAPMIKAAKTIKKHWAGVLRWFTSRISNGILEAINGLIQSAKVKARGFRSSRYLITMVYLIAGKLDFKLPAFTHATHTK